MDREGRTLIDGGVIAFIPVRAALQAGGGQRGGAVGWAGEWPLRPTIPPRRAGAVASRAGLLLWHQQIERDLHEVSQQIPTVILPTGIETWPAPWDFRHSSRLIDTASLAAGRFLDGLRVNGPGLYRVNGPPATATPGRFVSGAGR